MILSDIDQCSSKMLNYIAAIYLQEWGWHYVKEWDINKMIDDIRNNFMSCIYVATLPDETSVETVSR